MSPMYTLAQNCFLGVVVWLGNNLAPSTKRGVGMAIHISLGNLAGAIASGVCREDAPHYTLGHTYPTTRTINRIIPSIYYFLVAFLFLTRHLFAIIADSVVIGFVCMGMILTPVTAFCTRVSMHVAIRRRSRGKMCSDRTASRSFLGYNTGRLISGIRFDRVM